MTEFEIDELRRAYQLLDVPHSSSKRSIKQAYRRVTKRWHPDRYASGTPAHAEATQMMKLINEAYSQMANAPLRYYDEKTTAPRRQRGSEAHRSPDPYADNPYVANIETRSEWLGRRIGAGFRFVAGGVFGVFVIWPFHISLQLAGHPVLAVVLVAGAFLGGGFVMLRYGTNVRWGRW